VNYLESILIQHLKSIAIKPSKTNIPIRVRIAKAERSIENAVLLLASTVHIGKEGVVTKLMEGVEKVHINELQISIDFIPKIINSNTIRISYSKAHNRILHNREERITKS
jgi:hypothetical protein